MAAPTADRRRPRTPARPRRSPRELVRRPLASSQRRPAQPRPLRPLAFRRRPERAGLFSGSHKSQRTYRSSGTYRTRGSEFPGASPADPRRGKKLSKIFPRAAWLRRAAGFGEIHREIPTRAARMGRGAVYSAESPPRLQTAPPQRLAVHRRLPVDVSGKLIKLFPHARMLWSPGYQPLHMGVASTASTIPLLQVVHVGGRVLFTSHEAYNSGWKTPKKCGVSIRTYIAFGLRYGYPRSLTEGTDSHGQIL